MSTAADRGSALVMTLFVLVLLTSMGIALLALSRFEMKMVQADRRAKVAFFLAEAGLEHAREALSQADAVSTSPGSLDDELAVSAGADGRIDFDPDTVRATHDGDGVATGFGGYGDDVPLLAATAFGEGYYVAFLTNDPLDGIDSTADTNGAVMITAFGAGSGHSAAAVQAIVRRSTFPGLPAMINLLGPDPEFAGGNSNAKRFVGDDCDGGDYVPAGGAPAGTPGLYVPVVGVLGSSAEIAAEAGVDKPATFVSGPFSGIDTVTDVDDAIHPSWKDCGYLLALAGQVRGSAALIGDASTPASELGTAGAPRTVFIEGDYTLSGGTSGAGLLWVTGELTSLGAVDWEGMIFVVGTGAYRRSGGGNGVFAGGWVVANVAGPDATLFTADDCSGPDGAHGTADDGFDSPTWAAAGGGNGDLVYCSTVIEASRQSPFLVDQFRER